MKIHYCLWVRLPNGRPYRIFEEHFLTSAQRDAADWLEAFGLPREILEPGQSRTTPNGVEIKLHAVEQY